LNTGEHKRIQRERKTIQAMIGIYCRSKHVVGQGLCAECNDLLCYAFARLDKCPFQADKPTCAKCSIHCYKPDMRARVRQVMRFSGPRMIIHHPVLAFQHMLDSVLRASKRQKKQ